MNAWEHSRSDGINSWLQPLHDFLNGGSKWVPRWSIWSRLVEGGEEYNRPGDTIT